MNAYSHRNTAPCKPFLEHAALASHSSVASSNASAPTFKTLKPFTWCWTAGATVCWQAFRSKQSLPSLKETSLSVRPPLDSCCVPSSHDLPAVFPQQNLPRENAPDLWLCKRSTGSLHGYGRRHLQSCTTSRRPLKVLCQDAVSPFRELKLLPLPSYLCACACPRHCLLPRLLMMRRSSSSFPSSRPHFQ